MALPANWFTEDIGNVGNPGTGNEVAGVFTLQDSGRQVYDRADSGRFVYQHTGGNGVITARVTTIASPNNLAQAGVSWRESLLPDAKSVSMFVTPKGLELVVRRWRGYSVSIPVQVPNLLAPYYVRITRTGKNFVAEYSANGSSWIQIGSTVRVTMLASSLTGLLASSHDSVTLRNSTFDNVTQTATLEAAHFYVSPDAITGSGAGTWSSPWSLWDGLNLQTGSIPAGSFVNLRGVNHLTGVPTPYPAKFPASIAGSVGNRTTIRSYPGERAIIDGDTRSQLHITSAIAASGTAPFTVSNADYLVPLAKMHIGNEDIRIINPLTGLTVGSYSRADNGTIAEAHANLSTSLMVDSIIKIQGAYTDWLDILVRHSDNNRQGMGFPYPGGDSDKWPTLRGPGLSVQAQHVRLLFPVIHDAQEGINDFSFTDMLAYGAILFNGGMWGTNRPPNNGNGHGFYVQNSDPLGLVIQNCLSLHPFSAALKAGSVNGPVDHITIDHNILVGGGSLGQRGDGRNAGQFALEVLSDGKPCINPIVSDNTVVGNPRQGSQAFQFGYSAANSKGGQSVRNFITSGNRGVNYQNWYSLIDQDNLIYITNGDNTTEVELKNYKFLAQGAASGVVNVNGTAVTWVSGDRFNWSWGTGLLGTPSSIVINGTTVNIVLNSTSDDGTTMTISTNLGVLNGVAYVQPSTTTGHPIAVVGDTNDFFSGVGIADQGTVGSANQTRREYQFAYAEPGFSPTNRFGGGALRFAPDFPVSNADHSFQRWTNLDIPAGVGVVDTSGTTVNWVSGDVFNTTWVGETIQINGSPFTVLSMASVKQMQLTATAGVQAGVAYSFNPANVSAWTDGKPTGVVTRFNANTAFESAFGYVAYFAIINWDDAATVLLTAANLSTVLSVGDRFEIINAFDFFGAPIFEGVYAGIDITLPMTSKKVTPAIGLGFIPESMMPRLLPGIVRQL